MDQFLSLEDRNILCYSSRCTHIDYRGIHLTSGNASFCDICLSERASRHIGHAPTYYTSIGLWTLVQNCRRYTC